MLTGRTIKALLDKHYAGALYPVNPKYPEIAGLPCYPDVASIPGAVDLAVVAVPAQRVPQTLRELGAKGIAAAVVFSSGFSEVGGDGVALERELKTAIRESGVRVLGPNCLGLINAFENVMATFSQFSLGPTPPGPAAFVTQSGALGTATAGMARRCWFADAVARSALALPRLDLPAAPGPVATLAAQALLDRCGVKTVASRLARSAEEAVSAAPVALKIESPDIPHKTEAQAVKLGLGDASAVRQAHTRSIEEQGASRRGARQTAGRSGRRDAGCRRGLVFRRRRRRTFEGTGPQSNSREARRRRRRRLADRVDVNIPRQSRGLASPGWDPQRPLSEIASGSLWAEVGVC